MRLGEIIQMQVADVKTLDGIDYFDVTPVAIEPSDDEADDAEEEKSLKTASSRRGIPIHKTLFDLGFGEFLEFRRASRGETALSRVRQGQGRRLLVEAVLEALQAVSGVRSASRVEA